MIERNLFRELADGLDALNREREGHGLPRKIKITRFRFRKMRKTYGESC
jgi:ribosomal protein S14